MFGIRYLKVPPTTHVIQYKKGRPVRQGSGLAFFYYEPNSVIVMVPVNSIDVPFVFEEVAADFQSITIQGELTYRIVDAKILAALLDFSVDGRGRYRSDDPSKLHERLIHVTQTLARSYAQARSLDDLVVGSNALVETILGGLQQSKQVEMLGVEVLGLSVIAIKPMPDMAKAMEAAARERLLGKADQAVYERRNAAVAMERQIKESELNTEIAVEQKRRQMRETKMAADIAVEEQRAALVGQRVENQRKEAEARGQALRATLEPLKDVDWRTLLAAGGGLGSRQLIALAFHDLATQAEKIGHLSITPELLASLMADDGLDGPAQAEAPAAPPTGRRK
jgi:hypothetical protein